MLNVGNLTQSQSKAIFANSKSITMLPVVSAEWNHNLFNPPYVTVSGDGILEDISTTDSLTSITDSNKHPNFTTNSFTLVSGTKKISYTIDDNTLSNVNHKVVMYAKTNSLMPILINAYSEGANQQIGSVSLEINSVGWTKIEVCINTQGTISSDTIFNIVAHSDNLIDSGATIYITVPESYKITDFDYKYGSMWPTSSPFKFLRSGESYIKTGNKDITHPGGIAYPLNYRRIASKILNSETLSGGFYGNKYMPINPIIYNPKFLLASIPVPIYKNGVPNNVLPYQYFISDSDNNNKTITAFYEKPLASNKIVLKFNVLMSTPTVSIKLDGTSIGIFTPNSEGILILYYNGTTWSETAWTSSNMPKFSDNGELTPVAGSFEKITVKRESETLNSAFNISQYTRSEEFDQFGVLIKNNINPEMTRLQIIEISPRLEIDLTDFVKEVSINKSLDSKNSYIPISSINSNDASITLSGIPTNTVLNFTPIFSSQSDSTRTILSKMLRKNIKFYLNYNLISYDQTTAASNTFIPGGVFYSDTWGENDINDVSIQAYDVSRYLQTAPVPDLVSTSNNVFDVITNLLDKAGFTDYDYDSLYEITNDLNISMDMFYYFASAKDTTIIDALSEIFLAYQIGAYIDEYSIMKFLSLSNILTNKNAADISLSQDDITQDGYSISNKSKPGKLSLRYNPPKIKQSASLQNIKNIGQKESPSFILTTSNDVVWSQQNLDSVGFNYLAAKDYNDNPFIMTKDSNKFCLDVNDVLDIFHTYSLNANGYAVIENEIVSFANKEYTIESEGLDANIVSVKNDLELQSEISKYSKKNKTLIKTTSAEVTSISADGTYITYTANNNFTKLVDKVSVINSSDIRFNIQGKLIEDCTSTFFKVKSTTPAGSGTGGKAVSNSENNITISPTGYITNVQRGLFGTKVSDHKLLSTLIDKGLSQATIDSNYDITTGGTNASPDTDKYKIIMNCPASKKLIIYPTNQVADEYKTYSMKFDIQQYTESKSPTVVAGLFFNLTSTADTDGAYFVEFVKYIVNSRANYSCAIYRIVSGSPEIIAWSDITAIAESALAHMPKVLQPNPEYVPESPNTVLAYEVITDMTFNLKVTHYNDNTENGNFINLGDPNAEAIAVFLNNIEITGWQIPIGSSSAVITNAVKTAGTVTYTASNTFAVGDFVVVDGITPSGYNLVGTVSAVSGSSFDIHYSSADSWVSLILDPYVSGGTATESGALSDIPYEPIGINLNTMMMKKVILPSVPASDGIFGAYASSVTVMSDIISEIPIYNSDDYSISIKELHATQKPLREKSVNYFYQDREFLNGIMQGQKFANNTYLMQTKPEVVGMNYYDVQYTNPAASIVDVLPIEYLWHYFPTNSPADQKYFQTQMVDEYALAYSTPINTGFKAKMAIVNNSPHMVYLNKESDDLNQFTVRLNLWTHEIITTSDQQILEVDVDSSNTTEVAQIDSQWIQSTDSANRVLNLIAKGLDGFSRDVSLEIFGNPLIQVGDIVELTYSLNGINQQRYVVHSVSQSFQEGLSTQLVLNKIGDGISNTTSYTVTYDEQGGTAVTDTNYYPGERIILPSNLSKSGYNFIGWFTQSSGGTVLTSPYFPPGIGNITLYAQWELSTIIYYDVFFDEQGGSSVSNTTYVSGGSITLPSAPTRTGYTFNGWFSAATGGSALTSPYSPSGTGNITLYAQWSAISYSVTYDEQGGSAVSNTTYTIGKSINLPTAPTRSGYTFNGWFTAPSGGSALTSPYSPLGTGNIILYAQWTTINYTVTFNNNGADGGSTAPQSTNVPTALTSNGFTYTGYEFTGWNTSADGSGTSYADGATYNFATNITLYAQWLVLYVYNYNFESVTSPDEFNHNSGTPSNWLLSFAPYDWSASVTPLQSYSLEQAHSGLKSMKVEWNALQEAPQTYIAFSFLNDMPGIVESITMSAWVYVPTGSPDVLLTVSDGQYGLTEDPIYTSPYVSTSLKNQWVNLEMTVTVAEFQYLSAVSGDYFNIEPDYDSLSAGVVYVDDVTVTVNFL